MTDKRKADRVLVLLETKGPHQLAEALVSMEDRLQAAIEACARMQEQRDQLAAQLKDATAQCGVMAEVMRDAFAYIDDDQDHSIETGKPLPDNCASLLSRIDAALAGKLPEPVIFMDGCSVGKTTSITLPEGWQLVPMEPTREMMLHKSGCDHHAHDDLSCPARRTRATIWAHMLAAAPKQEGGE